MAERGKHYHASGGGSIALPVVDTRHIKPSGVIRWRAAVLIAVNVLIVAHVLQWWLGTRYGWFGGGTTITPIEPSESMEFVRRGIVNAGLIFFGVTLMATLVLGRWFCGWGCHVVAIQDLCLWLMRRVGIKPKPFRSRFLAYVPLAVALYMFAWPPFYRLVLAPLFQPDLAWPGVSLHLTTTSFWKTFAGVGVAVPFLAVCGFATVYVLGAKGFCTYGCPYGALFGAADRVAKGRIRVTDACPYGGFFAPLDRLAVGSIRVTDDCRQCGHCTAVCPSNVRVHEEVKTHGMIVDSGCMKSFDCVSVCPNDALYFGFGTPSGLRRAASRSHFDLSMRGEFMLAGLFLASLLSFRGVAIFSTRDAYGLVPLLMAVGMAGVTTWMLWKGWRVLRDPNASFHRWRLKQKGWFSRAGVVFTATATLLGAFVLQCGVVQGAMFVGNRMAIEAGLPRGPVLPPADLVLDRSSRALVDRALAVSTIATVIGEGGFGLASNPNVDMALAKLHFVRGEHVESARLVRRVQRRADPSEQVALALARILHADGRDEALARHYDEQLARHPDWMVLWVSAIDWSVGTGHVPGGIARARGAVDANPEALPLLRRLAVLLVQTGSFDEAIAIIRRAIDVAPGDPLAWATLAQVMALHGDLVEADAAIAEALRLAPGDETVQAEAALFERIRSNRGE